MLSSAATNMKVVLRHAMVTRCLCSANRTLFTCPLYRQGQQNVPTTKPGPKSVEAESYKDEFTPIFRFPYIAHAHALCRLKLYQTGVTLLLLPANRILYTLELVSFDQVKMSFFVTGFACAVLYVTGVFFRRLVGFLYLNKAKDKLKVSHLTFWGFRRDVVLPLSDIMTFVETGGNPKNVYHCIKAYSNNERYYYIIRFGGILQPKLFQEVFGDHQL